MVIAGIKPRFPCSTSQRRHTCVTKISKNFLCSTLSKHVYDCNVSPLVHELVPKRWFRPLQWFSRSRSFSGQRIFI